MCRVPVVSKLLSVRSSQKRKVWSPEDLTSKLKNRRRAVVTDGRAARFVILGPRPRARGGGYTTYSSRMAVKPAPKAVFPAGPTDFGKRKTKALQKRPYQAPQITKLIRPPAVGPVDARPESESSGSSGSDDSDDDANSSDSESKSMEIDEDSTATAISTEKPTEIKSAKTTRSVYKSAEIAFPDGRKSVVKFGSAVNVRFFDGDENCEDVTTCYALVREIWSVRRNDERMKSLGKEATEEEVGSGIMFNVSWLLDLNELTKNWQHEPSYPIPDNERFYDPREIDTVLPANVTCVEPVWFLSARRNMSNRSAIPPESSKQLFVNKIVGTKSRAGKTSKFVAYSMTDKDFCDQHKEHIERVRTLLAPKEEDVAGLFEVSPAAKAVNPAAEKEKAKEKLKPPPKKKEKAKPHPSHKSPSSEKRKRDAEVEDAAAERRCGKTANMAAGQKKHGTTERPGIATTAVATTAFVGSHVAQAFEDFERRIATAEKKAVSAEKKTAAAQKRVAVLENLLAQADAAAAASAAAAKTAAMNLSKLATEKK